MYISHGRLSCDGLQHIYQQGLASSSRDAALLTATSQTSQQQPAGPCLQVGNLHVCRPAYMVMPRVAAPTYFHTVAAAMLDG